MVLSVKEVARNLRWRDSRNLVEINMLCLVYGTGAFLLSARIAATAIRERDLTFFPAVMGLGGKEGRREGGREGRKEEKPVLP